MRIYKRTLIPATAFFVIGCLLSAILPISGANWNEVLTISGNVESISLPPSPPPKSQAGTTLSATKTATGFAEERDGIVVYGVRGEVCVANGGERPTQGLAILDTVQTKNGAGQFQDYVSEPVDVSVKPVLEPGQEQCYAYEFTFAPLEGKKVKYRNTVSVTILNHSGWLLGGNHCEGPDPCPFGPNPKADFTLPEEVSAPVELLSTEPPPSEPAATEPPATEPPPSELAVPDQTEPPSTEPVATEPPPSEPAGIEAPATESPPRRVAHACSNRTATDRVTLEKKRHRLFKK